jgi:hemerythrin
MIFFQWTEAFSVKIKSIDEQHKKIILTINDLHSAISKKDAPQVSETLLANLAKVLKENFLYEENLFTKYQFPHGALHQKGHQDLLAAVTDLQQAMKNKKPTLILQGLTTLKGNFTNHMRTADMAYSAFLTSKGVK